MKTLKDLKVGDEVLVFGRAGQRKPEKQWVLKVGRKLLYVGEKDHPIIPPDQYRIEDGLPVGPRTGTRYIMTPDMHAFQEKVARANGRIFKFGMSFMRRPSNEEVMKVDELLSSLPNYPKEEL